MAGFAKLVWVDLECADPNTLAELYRLNLAVADVAEAAERFLELFAK